MRKWNFSKQIWSSFKTLGATGATKIRDLNLKFEPSSSYSFREHSVHMDMRMLIFIYDLFLESVFILSHVKFLRHKSSY